VIANMIAELVHMRMEQLGFKVTRTPYYTLIHTYSVLLPSIFLLLPSE
jgi:hypothetical protein